MQNIRFRRTLPLLIISLVVFLASCSRETPLQEVQETPDIQLTGCCTSFGLQEQFMMEWAPFIEARLNNCVNHAPSGNMICNFTGVTTTKSKVDCYLHDPQAKYDGDLAAQNACSLRDWAFNQHPQASSGGNLTLHKWYISNFQYFYDEDSDDQCEGSCPNVEPLKFIVAYEKYSCSVSIEYMPHELEKVDFGIIGGPGDPHVTGEGTIELRMKPTDGPSPVNVTVLDPYGDVYASGTSQTAADDPDFQVFTFETVEYSLAELTVQLSLRP